MGWEGEKAGLRRWRRSFSIILIPCHQSGFRGGGGGGGGDGGGCGGLGAQIFGQNRSLNGDGIARKIIFSYIK